MKREIILALLVCGAAITWWALRAPEVVSPTHEVVRGDTLWEIAQSHGVSVDQLRRWNGLRGDRIEVGQVLVVGEGTLAKGEATQEARRAGTGVRARHPTPTVSPRVSPESAPIPLPDPLPCLAGPIFSDESIDEPSFAASVGLGRAQVRSAMRSFLPELGRCVDGDWPEGVANLAITVGCDGRVQGVIVESSDQLSEPLLVCVTDTLQYAPFPAHDMPDGFVFHFPLSFDAE